MFVIICYLVAKEPVGNISYPQVEIQVDSTFVSLTVEYLSSNFTMA